MAEPEGLLGASGAIYRQSGMKPSEIAVALIITIGLSIGLLGIFDGARSADFTPVEPVCHARYQITHKAVLRCDDE